MTFEMGDGLSSDEYQSRALLCVCHNTFPPFAFLSSSPSAIPITTASLSFSISPTQRGGEGETLRVSVVYIY